jgi:hypothetical protein
VGAAGDGARSYLDDGRVVTWCPAPTSLRYAVDAERRREPPVHLLPLADGDFWVWWTRLEVVCKLLDIPVLVALRDGLPPHKVALRTEERDGLVISYGALDAPC